MKDPYKIVKGAIDRHTEDEENAKAITAHFEAQADLFTQCQICKQRVSGTIEQIRAHQCFQFGDLIGAA